MIRDFPVPARRLVTIREDHPAWSGKDFADNLHGALVRLMPPEGASEERISEILSVLEERGVVRTKVVSSSRPAVVSRRIDVDPSPPRTSLRGVVTKIASEVRSKNPKALLTLVDGILTEEGL